MSWRHKQRDSPGGGRGVSGGWTGTEGFILAAGRLDLKIQDLSSQLKMVDFLLWGNSPDPMGNITHTRNTENANVNYSSPIT